MSHSVGSTGAIHHPFAAALWLHHQEEVPALYSAVQAQVFQGFKPL